MRSRVRLGSTFMLKYKAPTTVPRRFLLSFLVRFPVRGFKGSPRICVHATKVLLRFLFDFCLSSPSGSICSWMVRTLRRAVCACFSSRAENVRLIWNERPLLCFSMIRDTSRNGPDSDPIAHVTSSNEDSRFYVSPECL